MTSTERRKVKRSNSLDNLLKSFVPKFESQEKEESQTTRGIKPLYGNKEQAGTGETNIQVKIPPKRSFRRKRRTTLADLRCIDIVKPVLESEEEKEEGNDEIRFYLRPRSKSSHNLFRKNVSLDAEIGGQKPVEKRSKKCASLGGSMDTSQGSLEDSVQRSVENSSNRCDVLEGDSTDIVMEQHSMDTEGSLEDSVQRPVENSSNRCDVLGGDSTDIVMKQHSMDTSQGSLEDSVQRPVEKSSNRCDVLGGDSKDSGMEQLECGIDTTECPLGDGDFDSDFDNSNDMDEVCSCCSDDSTSSLEVMNAVSNYEISYDVGEDENSVILERLNNASNDSDCSDSSQSPVEVEDLYETLNNINETFKPRKRSFSLDGAMIASMLPSITEESRRGSFCSNISEASSFNDDVFTSRKTSTTEGMFDAKTMAERLTDYSKDEIYNGSPSVTRSVSSPDVLASRILRRRSITALLAMQQFAEKRGSIDDAQSQKYPESKEERQPGNDFSDKIPGSSSTSTLPPDETSRNLVNALKQKVRATLRRRNSIASTKPWTGAVERSIRTSFGLPRKEDNNDDEEVEDVHTEETQDVPNATPLEIDNKIESLDEEKSSPTSSTLSNKESMAVAESTEVVDQEDVLLANSKVVDQEDVLLANSKVVDQEDVLSSNSKVVEQEDVLSSNSKVVDQEDVLSSNSKVVDQEDVLLANSKVVDQEDVLSSNSKVVEQEDVLSSNSKVVEQEDVLSSNSKVVDQEDVLSSNSKVVVQEDVLSSNSKVDKKENASTNARKSRKVTKEEIVKCSTSSASPKRTLEKADDKRSHTVKENSSTLQVAKTSGKNQEKGASNKTITESNPSKVQKKTSLKKSLSEPSPTNKKEVAKKPPSPTLQNKKKSASPQPPSKPLRSQNPPVKKFHDVKAERKTGVASKVPAVKPPKPAVPKSGNIKMATKSTQVSKTSLPEKTKKASSKETQNSSKTNSAKTRINPSSVSSKSPSNSSTNSGNTKKSSKQENAKDSKSSQSGPRTVANATSKTDATMTAVSMDSTSKKPDSKTQDAVHNSASSNSKRSASSTQGNKQKKDGATRNTSVNVMRRPRSPFSITISSTPKTQIEEKKPTNMNRKDTKKTEAHQNKSDNQIIQIGSFKLQNESSTPSPMKSDSDKELQNELDSFGTMLGEFENPPASSEKNDCRADPGRKTSEMIPTDKRFAALSERYNAIMSKFRNFDSSKEKKPDKTVGDRKSEEENPTKPPVPVNEGHTDNRNAKMLDKMSANKEVGNTQPADVKINKADENKEVSSSKLRYGNACVLLSELETTRLLVNGTPPSAQLSPESCLFGTRVDNQRNQDNTKVNTLQGVAPGKETPRKSLTSRNTANRSQLSWFQEGNQIPINTEIFREEGKIELVDIGIGIQEKVIIKLPIEENKSTPLANKFQDMDRSYADSVNLDRKIQAISQENSSSAERIPEMQEERIITSAEKIGNESGKAYVHKEIQIQAGERRRSLTSAVRSFNTPVQSTTSSSSLGNKELLLTNESVSVNKGSYTASLESRGSLSAINATVPRKGSSKTPPSARTTVIAQLIDRKLGPRQRQSIVPDVVARKTRVFKDQEAGIQNVPLTMEEFNKYRTHVEIVKLKTTVKTEALSIHEVLSCLSSSLSEMELVALCKECTKTLRTLDALGSLPSYLSADTVIVNPSGTIKFRHLSTEVKIDGLLLAPDHTRNYSQSEKTCVFSLAVILWLAADWKLTEAQKPSMSQPFQELLVSMSNDSSTERPTFDFILQTCELLQTDEMTSRERCQALLWECQATKVLDTLNADKKANEESTKTKAQHSTLMGSISVAANFKGFLKHTEPPSERNVFPMTPSTSDVLKQAPVSSKPFSKDDQEFSLKNTKDQEIQDHNDLRNPKSSSAPLNRPTTHHPIMDPNMMFSPINHVSGSPLVRMSPLPSGDISFRNQPQGSGPTFVPIAVPVPATGPPPMWYMTPSGMIPFSQMGHHPGYFVPLQHGSASSTVSESDMEDVSNVKPARHRSARPSTPKSEKDDRHPETKRSTASTIKSKIPRPVWNSSKRSSPKPPSPSTTISKPETPVNPRHNPRKTSLPNLGSPYRSHTPPTRLRSGSIELERDTRRRSRSSIGSGEQTLSRSGEVPPRAPSPRSRPSSPSLTEANSGSRPSSPVGSRSSSPVSMLISKFEELSSESQFSENTQSVSNLLNKFGSSSLLSEDRITKRHFRTSSAQSSKTGPLRPSSALERSSDASKSLSKSWSGRTNESSNTLSNNNESATQSSPVKFASPEKTYVTRKYSASSTENDNETGDERRNERDSLLLQTRNRLLSSLENLYGYSKELDEELRVRSSLRGSTRTWSSMENVHRESTVTPNTSSSLRKSSSTENLSNRDLVRTSCSKEDKNISRNILGERNRDQTKSWIREKSGETLHNQERQELKGDLTFNSAYKKDSDILDIFGKAEKNSDSVRDVTMMAPERVYQLDNRKDLSSLRNRFQIPVAIAVMESNAERLGTNPFSPTMFSPSAAKDKGFFQHPIKLEKDSTPQSPPAPSSPSVKDCQPTSYFTSLSFSKEKMEPERDTGLAHAPQQNHWTENTPNIDPNSRLNSYISHSSTSDGRLYDSDSKNDKETHSSSSKQRHSKSTNPSERHADSSSSSNSSKPSSRYHSDYLERFERQLTRNCSNNSEEEQDIPRNDHHLKGLSSTTTKSKNVDSPAAHTKVPRSTEIENPKESPLKESSNVPASPTNSSSSQSMKVSATPPSRSKTKRSSVPNTPSTTSSSNAPLGSNTSHIPNKNKSSSVPSTPTPNSDSKYAPFFKYVSPNSSPKKSSSSKPPSTAPSPTVEKSSHPASSASSNSPLFDFSETAVKGKLVVDSSRESKVDLTNVSSSTRRNSSKDWNSPTSTKESKYTTEMRGTPSVTDSKAKSRDTFSSTGRRSSNPSKGWKSPTSSTESMHPTELRRSSVIDYSRAQDESRDTFSSTGRRSSNHSKDRKSPTSPTEFRYPTELRRSSVIDYSRAQDESRDTFSSTGRRSSTPSKDWNSPNSSEPRSPTSPISSSSSSSSSPSPRFPINNKFIFYSPQSEAPQERHLSPTEQMNNLGQKGFVITDTSRQKKVSKKVPKAKETGGRPTATIVDTEAQSHGKVRLKNEKHEKQTLKGSVKPCDEEHNTTKKESPSMDINDNIVKLPTSKSDTKLYEKLPTSKSDAKLYEKLPTSKSDTKLYEKLPTNESDAKLYEKLPTNESDAKLYEKLPTSKSDAKLYEKLPTSKSDAKLYEKLPTSKNDAKLYEKPEEVKKDKSDKNTPKESAKKHPKDTDPKMPDPRKRRGSIDLREIYLQARRSSPAAAADTGKVHEITNNGPKQRPPSPGRVDSKELLGHLVKKVLNSACGKPSPTTSHTDLNHQQNKEPVRYNIVPDTGVHTKDNAVQSSNKQRKSSRERKQAQITGEETVDSQHRKASFETKQTKDSQEVAKTGKRHPSYERKQHDIVHERGGLQPRRVSQERGQQSFVQEKIVAKTSAPANAIQPTKSVEDIPKTAESSKWEDSNERRTSVESSGEKDVLAKLVDMIHDEFAFDGYLDDGIEDVNMAEYVISLAGMSEEMFTESISDQYNDLYWDEDLLQDMYILVNKTLRRRTLRFSESTISDRSRPGSVLSTDSHQEMDHMRSISRTSSERSFVETRDFVMSSLGEPSTFLPFKVIAPEIIRDVIDELGPVFEDYQTVMKIKLSPSISDLLDNLGAKILEIGQQLTLERRAKRKNITSFNKVADVDNKKDVKDLANKLLQEIEESDKKIIYLKYIQRRLRNIYAERFGLDHSLLHSFVNSYDEASITLEPKRQNSFLSFSPLWDQRANQSPECYGESARGPVLQYGTKNGLLSYLFARNSMSQAFVRYFLYTYRYCATPNHILEFIRHKCRASLRADCDKTYNHQLQIRYRALDLLAEWVHCCYQFDFKTNPDLLDRLVIFLNEELIPVDRTERGSILIDLIAEKQRKDQQEQTDETTDATAVLQTEETQASLTEKDSPRKNKRKHKSPVQCFKRGSPQASSMYKPTLHLKAMSVIDHSSRTIAEQLTLIQQDTFARVHSIHFLNSRTLGIGVGRSSTTKETSQQDSILGFSAGFRRSIPSVPSPEGPLPKLSDEHSLFEGGPITDGCLETLLMHAQDVSMWIAVEICSAPSVKNQLVLIQKYISVAKYCAEMRNFATCVQVVDALGMFVIRQLPVWKQVPNKAIQTLEELKAMKVILKTDSTWLIKDIAYREKPTIPCSLLFLMHVQQLELGGFTLANGMFKWTKMRSIARLVDHIRLFKQMRYAFEANDELAYRLRARILECREQNLHALAAENATNFHLSSSQSSRKFQEAFKKMKATFGNG